MKMPVINLALTNMNSKILIILCWLQLAACSTNTVIPFTPAAARPDQAVVYIYRPTEMANALYSPGLIVDDEFKLYIKNSVNNRLSLTPGEHLFAFQAEKKYSSLTPLALTLNAGTISYIRVSTSLKVNNTGSYEPYTRSFKFTPVEEPLALIEISQCCVDDSMGASDKNESDPAATKSSEEFSVDKTQNPFSH